MHPCGLTISTKTKTMMAQISSGTIPTSRVFLLLKTVLSCTLLQRRHFTKLRISAHNLIVETGRYTRPKTQLADRLCLLCDKSEIEDEYHMLMSCPTYSNERETFIKALSEFSTIVFTESPDLYHILNMQCNQGDFELSNTICEYVTACFMKRNSSFSQGQKKPKNT